MKSFHAFVPMTSTIPRWLIIIGLVVAWPLGAAWDRVLPDPDLAAAAFHPAYLGTPDAEGYWATGVVEHRGAVARFNNNGSLRWLRFADDQKMVEPVGGGDALSAGDLHFTNQCTLRRWRADGSLAWRSRVDDAHQCRAMKPDGNGGAWILLRTDEEPMALRRVAADGVVHAMVDLPSSVVGKGARVAADPVRGGIYIAGSRSRPDPQDTRTDAVIIAVDHAGALRWQWLAPAQVGGGGTMFRDVVAGDDGFAYVAGTESAGPWTNLIVASFSGDGALRFQRRIDVRGITTVEQVLVADVGIYVIVGLDGHSGYAASMRVLQIDDTGTILRTHELPSLAPMREPGSSTAWRSRDGKRLAVAGWHFADLESHTRLVQLSAAGQHMARLPPQQPLSAAQLLDNAAAVVVSGNTSYYPEITTTLLQFDSSGQAQPAPEPMIGWRERALFGAALDADGTSYLATRDGTGWDSAIERIGADGVRDWRVTRSPGVLSVSMPMSVVGNRVCYAAKNISASAFVVECLNASNGQRIFAREFSDVIDGPHLTRLRVLSSGAVLVWYWQTAQAGEGRGTHFAHIRADGSLLFDQHLRDFPSALDIGPTGIGVIQTSGVPTPSVRRVVVYGADGRLLLDLPDDFHPYSGTRGVQVAADGSLLMLGALGYQNGDSDNIAKHYSPNGMLRWSVDLEGPSRGIIEARIDGNALIYLTGAADTGQRFPTYVVKSLLGKRSMVDGSLIWQREVLVPGNENPTLAIDPVSGDVALTSLWPAQRIRVQSFDAASGAPRLDRSESCAARACKIFATVFGSDSQFRVLTETDTVVRALRTPTFMLNSPLRAPAPLRVDQPGIVGAWFPDYASGQGLVIDYLPATRTLFAPWFVYAPDGANSLAAQRWFTLQGSPSAGATEVELGIYRNTGGMFASLPSTTAQRVGSARLTLESCARAALDYAFDAPDMARISGRYTLTRATAGIGDCAAQQPAMATPAKSQTSQFDARLSGSWHVPAQSGQGLMLSVTPASLLFATWFTYDPAGAADDATAQHWFTLQAGLDGHTGDTLILPIYRTIGGSFDRDPTANTYRVGEATLSVQSCDRASLVYRFDASELAAGFAGLNGTLALEKIGGCSP